MAEMRRSWVVAPFCLLVAGISLDAGAEDARPTTTRVSLASDGSQATGLPLLSGNSVSDVTADGRIVVFLSGSALVPEDTNGSLDIYARDRTAGTTARVSLTAAGGQSRSGITDYYDGLPSISSDGRYVAFGSGADDFVVEDTNEVVDIFVRDRVAGTTERISISGQGEQANADAGAPSISADGRYVAFTSMANTLVPGDTNDHSDIFIRDRAAGTTTRASVSATGGQANDDSYEPSLSADGRRVAFTSRASNIASGDDRYSLDVFVRDLDTDENIRASSDLFGWFSYGPDLSADGRAVAFTCYTSVCVTDLVDRTVSVAAVRWDGREARDDSSRGAAISADGRYVAFSSEADLVRDDVNRMRDFFVRDRVAGQTFLASVSWTGEQQGTFDGIVLTWSDRPAISADGSTVVFSSEAPNLVPDDTNMIRDVFAYEIPGVCANGTRKVGPVSRRASNLEVGPLAGDLRGANCDLAGDGL